MRNSFLATILLFIITQSSFALTFSFQGLSIENGLNSRQTLSIIHDDTGFLWIATGRSIERYDGSVFSSYLFGYNEGTKKYLVRSPKNEIFVVFQFNNIYRYNPEKDRFDIYLDTDKEISTQANILATWFDNKCNLYIGTDIGLYRKMADTGTTELIQTVPQTNIWGIINVNDKILVFTSEETYSFNMTESGIDHTYSETIDYLKKPGRIQSLYFDNSTQKLYIGSYNKGLSIINMGTKSMKKIPAIPDMPVRSICPYKGNDMLIGSDGGGLIRIDRYNDELIETYLSNNDNPYSISSNDIYSILTTDDNTIWAATYTGGLNYSYSSIVTPNYYKHEYRNPNSLFDNTVNSILEDSLGDIWIGTLKGISRISPTTGKWQHYLDTEDNNSVSHRNILAMTQSSDGTIWAGGYMTGLIMIDPITGNIKILKSALDGTGPGTDSIYYLCTDKDGDIWIGGINGRLSRYNPNSRKFFYYPVNVISSVVMKGEETLYIGTPKGLLVLNKKSGEIVQDTFLNEHFNTDNLTVNCMTLQGTSLWLGTARFGLIYYNTADRKIKVYNRIKGYTFNTIYSISQDIYGKIWATSDNELIKINPDSEELSIIRSPDKSNEWLFTNLSSCSLRNSDILIGTTNGVIKIDTAKNIDENEIKSKIYFTDLNISYHKVEIGKKGSPLDKVLNQTENIVLKHNQNSFSIGFSDISFFRGYNHLYSYNLEGFDSKWSEAGPQKNASYTNIPPGKYIFHIRSFGNDGKNILDERTLNIRIKPPIYLTVWAYIIYFFLLGGIILESFNIYYHWLKNKNAKDKVRFFINIAHEIRTPVTLIKAPLSEISRSKQLTTKDRENLNIALSNSDKLLEMVSLLLDIERVSSDMMNLSVSEFNLNSYLIETIENLGALSIDYNVKIEVAQIKENINVWFDKSKMDKILENLIHSSIRIQSYNKDISSKIITISAETDNDNVRISITNHGIGISKGERKKIFKQLFNDGSSILPNPSVSDIGLILTNSLVSMHKGAISFESSDGSGIRFTIILKKGNSHYSRSQISIQHSPSTYETNLSKYVNESERKVLQDSILVVENNDGLRQYLTSSLSSNYNIIESRNAVIALDILHNKKIDMVITDIIMPDLNGIDFCRQIKSDISLQHIPVVILTDLSNQDEILRGLKAGADDYITKPFDMGILKQKINNLISSRNNIRAFYIRKNLSGKNEVSSVADTISNSDKEFIESLTSAVNKHISDSELSVYSLCRYMGISHTILFNKTKRLLGIAPNEYIRTIRLNRAKELIQEKKYSIGEISDKVGFSDQKYFSTAFKKHFGISPKKFENKT
ncbi:MAG: response regulator [Candidatus Cryptobacteroides sp.]